MENERIISIWQKWFPTFLSAPFQKLAFLFVSMVVLIWIPLVMLCFFWSVAREKTHEIHVMQIKQQMTQHMRRIFEEISAKVQLERALNEVLNASPKPLFEYDLDEAGREISNRIASIPSLACLWLVKYPEDGGSASVRIFSPPVEKLPFKNLSPNRKEEEEEAAKFIARTIKASEGRETGYYPLKTIRDKFLEGIFGSTFQFYVLINGGRIWRTTISHKPAIGYAENFFESKKVSSQKVAVNSEGAQRPTAGDELCGFTPRGEGGRRATGRVPPFIEKRRKKDKSERSPIALFALFVESDLLNKWAINRFKRIHSAAEGVIITPTSSIQGILKDSQIHEIENGLTIARSIFSNPEWAVTHTKKGPDLNSNLDSLNPWVLGALLLLGLLSLIGFLILFKAERLHKINLTKRILGLFLLCGLLPFSSLSMFIVLYHHEQVEFSKLTFNQNLQNKIEKFWDKYKDYIQIKNEIFRKITREVGNQTSLPMIEKYLEKFIRSNEISGYFFLSTSGENVFDLKNNMNLDESGEKGERAISTAKLISFEQLAAKGFFQIGGANQKLSGAVIEGIVGKFLSFESYLNLTSQRGVLVALDRDNEDVSYFFLDFPRDRAGKIQGVLTLMCESEVPFSKYFDKLSVTSNMAFQKDSPTILFMGAPKFEKYTRPKHWMQDNRGLQKVGVRCWDEQALIATSGVSYGKEDVWAVAVRTPSGLPGVTYAIVPMDALHYPHWAKNAFVLLSCLFILAACGHMLAKLLVLPLKTVILTVRKVAAHEQCKPLNLAGSREMQELSLAFNNMVNSLQELKTLRNFVSRSALDMVQGTERGDISAGGERTEAAVLFCGIKQFDEFCLRANSGEIIYLLETWFPIASRIISSHGGEVDKFIGAAVMGVFYAKNCPKFAIAAAKAACEMAEAAHQLKIDVRFDKIGMLSWGLGVNSGRVVAGRIGSKTGFLDYTMIGDTVNVAARLEALAAINENPEILVTAPFAGSVQEKFCSLPVGNLALKGKADLQAVCTIIPIQEKPA